MLTKGKKNNFLRLISLIFKLFTVMYVKVNYES